MNQLPISQLTPNHMKLNNIKPPHLNRPKTSMTSLGMLALLLGMASQVQAKTENLVLTASPEWSEEGIFLKTTQGSVSLQILAMRDSVLKQLSHIETKPGSCIEVTSAHGLIGTNEDGATISAIRHCPAGASGRSTNTLNSNTATSRFQINQASGQVSQGSCYMDSCSWSKSISTQILKQTASETVLKVTLLGATSENSAAARSGHPKRMVWNRAPHSLGITCSYSSPSVTVDGQTDLLPLNSDGVPGILESSAGLYFKYCHSYTGSVDSGIRKFGYHVQQQDD